MGRELTQVNQLRDVDERNFEQLDVSCSMFIIIIIIIIFVY